MQIHRPKPANRFNVFEMPRTLDFYRDSTLLLHEWLQKTEDGDKQNKELNAIQAITEVCEGKYHIPGETPDIRVAYDYATDGPFFIFRYRSNGRSLIVSNTLLSQQRDCSLIKGW